MHVLELIHCGHSYLYSILVFSYYYSSNTIQIAKGEKNVFYSNLFSLLKSIIIFFVRQRFLGVYTIFWKSTSPYSCFSFEVNNNFYRKWYINETTDYWAFLWYENHIFSFCYQKHLISFNFSGTHWNGSE